MITPFKNSTAALGALALVGLTAGAAHADYRFEMVNLSTSASVVQAWFAPAGTSEPWKAMTIYSAVGPRKTSPFQLTNPGGQCMFDFKVRFNDGYEQVVNNVDLCRATPHLIVT